MPAATPDPAYGRRRAVAAVAAALLAVLVVLAVRDACSGSGPRLTFHPAVASRYDGYGQPLACGGTLQTDTQGVAHRTLPCGTRLTIRYRGRTARVRVIDRGPYVAGRDFDLAGPTANALHFGGVHTIEVAVHR